MSIAHDMPKCPRRSKRNVTHQVNLVLDTNGKRVRGGHLMFLFRRPLFIGALILALLMVVGSYFGGKWWHSRDAT